MRIRIHLGPWIRSIDFRSDLEQDPDPDPLFHKTDQRIRIHIKMKRIRNTAQITSNIKKICVFPPILEFSVDITTCLRIFAKGVLPS